MAEQIITIRVEKIDELIAKLDLLLDQKEVAPVDELSKKRANAKFEDERDATGGEPSHADDVEDDDDEADKKPASRAQYAKLPDGSIIHVEKGELIPASPKDAGWKKATKAEYEAYLEEQNGGADDDDDDDTDDDDQEEQSENDKILAIDPENVSEAEFKLAVMAFSRNDTDRQRGNALLAHYGVKKLKEIDPKYRGDIVDMIQRAAKHFKTTVDEVPTSKNAAIVKNIGKLPVENDVDDEDEDF